MRSVWVVALVFGLLCYQVNGRFIVKRAAVSTTTSAKSEDSKETSSDSKDDKEDSTSDTEEESSDTDDGDVEEQKDAKPVTETTVVTVKQSNHVDDDNAEATE